MLPRTSIARTLTAVLPLLLAAALFNPPARGETITIPLADLRSTDPAQPANPVDALRQRLIEKLQQQFLKLGLSTQDQLVFGEFPVDGFTQSLADVCPIPLPMAIHADPTTAVVTLFDDSRFTLVLDEIRNVSVTLDLKGQINTRAKAWVRWGQAIPFVGNCEKIGTDNGTIDIALPFDLNLTADVTLEPRYDSERVAIIVDKRAVIRGSVTFSNGSITPDFGGVNLTDGIINAFEDFLLTRLTQRGEEQLAARIATLNLRLDGLDPAGNPDPAIDPFNAPSVFVIAQDPADLALTRAMLAELGIPDLVLDMLDTRGAEILLQLAVLDDAGRKALLAELGATIGCEALFGKYAANLPQPTVYTLSDGACTVAALEGPDLGRYFRDDRCQQPLSFRPTSQAQFCAGRFTPQAKQTLGNALAWEPDLDQPDDPLPAVPSRKWTVLPVTRLDVGTLSTTRNQQPFTKQLRYKTILNGPRGNGECGLEMRVYKKQITEQGLRPLLAIHGGTWKNRGFSFLGLEAMISHFTERGFVVFAPFYRLAGTREGNVECNAASWRQITADIEDALQFVKDHSRAFGAPASRVTVFGQSAGGHLAAWLASHRPDDVDKALLMYPPLDFVDFLRNAAPDGAIYAAFADFGMNALAGYYGAIHGDREVNLAVIDPAALVEDATAEQILPWIPETAFDLSLVDPTAPPAYLLRCASRTQTEITPLTLARPPAALLECLKSDLAEFLAENSFFRFFEQNPVVPLYSIQGAADELVPYAQTIKLCNRLDSIDRPLELTTDVVEYTCAQNSHAVVIGNANHALDLGLCVGPLCPAGPPDSTSRNAVTAALTTGYDWLTRDLPRAAGLAPPERQRLNPVERADPAPGPDASSSAGGGLWSFFLSMVLLARLSHRRSSRGGLERLKMQGARSADRRWHTRQ